MGAEKNHVFPDVGDVVSLVCRYGRGRVVQLKLPPTIHLLAILNESAGMRSRRLHLLVRTARLLSLGGTRSQSGRSHRRSEEPSKHGKLMRFHVPKLHQNALKVNLPAFVCEQRRVYF